MGEKNGGEINEQERNCNTFPSPQTYENKVKNILFFSEKDISHYLKMIRNLNELEDVYIPRYNTNRFQDNEDLRIKLLKNEITEQQWKDTLIRREKMIHKKQSIYLVLDMILQTTKNTFTQIMRSTNNKEIIDFHQQLYVLNQYAKDCLTNIKNRFQSKQHEVFCLSDTFKLK